MTGVQKLTKQRDLVAAAFNVIESKSRVLAVNAEDDEEKTSRRIWRITRLYTANKY
ncbi:hypothetical protein [Ligilactobacillus salivarius]|uniref:hypothetical protein n=1 Tax=Ligilactobacillus salivarius TaxID=1624 RepID=UPI001CBF6829|nr:hypothetical protein [Ligilactobacillus salivarius]